MDKHDTYYKNYINNVSGKRDQDQINTFMRKYNFKVVYKLIPNYTVWEDGRTK